MVKLPVDFPQFSTGSPPCRQKFPFPESLMSHIAFSKPQVYQKLTKACKYFYSKNPIIVVSRIGIYSKQILIDEHAVEIKSLKDFSFKFWLKDAGLISCRGSIDSEEFNILISKIYRANSVILDFQGASLKYSDLLLLASKATFYKGFIENSNINHDSPIDMSDVIKVFSNAKYLLLDCTPTLLFTSKTVKKLMEIPAFPNLNRLIISDISETIDLDEFVMFMQKHPKIRALLCFSRNIPQNYKNAVINSRTRFNKAKVEILI